MRNLAIAILKMAGAANIAASCRHHARDAASTLATLGLTPPGPKRTLRHYAEALTPTAPQLMIVRPRPGLPALPHPYWSLKMHASVAVARRLPAVRQHLHEPCTTNSGSMSTQTWKNFHYLRAEINVSMSM